MDIKTDNSNLNITARSFYINKLSKISWYKKSSNLVKKQITELPNKFDYFLKHLVNKAEFDNTVEILSIDDAKLSEDYIIPIFTVRSLLTNECFRREYVYKIPKSDLEARGVILVEHKNKTKYIILNKSTSFATGKKSATLINAFYPSFSNKKWFMLSSSTEAQVKKLLKLNTILIKKFIDLGTIYIDQQTTNSNVTLFAVVIEINNVTKLKLNSTITDKLEICNADRIQELIDKSNDSILLNLLYKIKNLVTKNR